MSIARNRHTIAPVAAQRPPPFPPSVRDAGDAARPSETGRHARWSRGAAFALAVLMLSAPLRAWASAPVPPASRAEAVEVIRELRKIVTPLGVERYEMVPVGGIPQFVSIRGADRRNPVLLIVHGGPGFPTSPIAWWGTHGLEEYFTVVHWDQRGAGKTYLASDPEKVAPTMTPDRFVDDTEELVAWLRGEFDKDKVFLLGTSWGSYVGLQFALRRPEWLHAYIGMGQAIDSPESERRGYAHALAAARAAGNLQAIADLESIAPYARSGGAIPLQDIALERRWSDHFGGVMAYRTRQIDGIAVRLSPEYSDEEARRAYEGNGYSQEFLFSEVVGVDMSHVTALRCPLIVLAGRHDRSVNSSVAREWFESVDAPSKHFEWFEHSAHEIIAEEPGKLLMTLVQYARPIAVRSGDVGQ
ncbi:alpha/beta fold hydrolase [Luteimonas saliphila]|uniref:alpha/beta hydrolase n=1 Tax=Luteimonas saliphila TaxID=2804919 RepID=UPI00192D5F5C